MIKPSELAPNNNEYQFNSNKTNNPKPNCVERNTHASPCVKSPFASGRFFVRSTYKRICLKNLIIE